MSLRYLHPPFEQWPFVVNLFSALLAYSVNCLSASVQIPSEQIQQQIEQLERFGDQRQHFPEKPLQQQQSPPPKLPLPPPPASTEDHLSTAISVEVKKIQLHGNTVFSDDQLAPIITPYEGRIITTEDLFSLRNALTLFYTNAGYINSGAVIPDQRVVDGVIKIDIIEGSLTHIHVNSENWLQDAYITSRLKIGNEDVLNVHLLQDRIKRLHEDRLIRRINAELVPGEQPGESILNLNIDENRLFNFGVDFNNHRTPSIGELQGEIYGDIYNVTGFGDALSVRFGITEGLNSYYTAYSVPISPFETRIRVYFEHNDADIIEEPFDVLKIRSDSSTIGLSISQPFLFSPQDRFFTSFTYESRRSDVTYSPFGFRIPFDSSLVENGQTRLSVFRFLQEWVHRSTDKVIAVRSTFNWGIDASRLLYQQNRINDDEFFSWLGQFQWVQRLGKSDIQAVLRADAQFSPDPLLPIEKFSVGGARTVRGYRENQMTRDNGVVASLELRVPLMTLPLPWLSNTPGAGSLQLAGFYDFGWAENNFDPNALDYTTISSAGIGIRWNPTEKIHSELYWAIPLNSIETPQNDTLQDQGIHFLLDIDLY